MADSHKSGRCHAVHILLAFHVVPEFVSVFHALLVYLSVCTSNQAFYDLYDFYDLCDQYGAGHRGDNTAQDWGGGANGSMNSGGVDKRVSLGHRISFSLEDSREDSRGSNVASGSGSKDRAVADGANTRDNTVAKVDSRDDSTSGQTTGNLLNCVGVGISLSTGDSHKQNLRIAMVNIGKTSNFGLLVIREAVNVKNARNIS